MICPKHDTGGGPCYCNGPRKQMKITLCNGHTINTNEFTDTETAFKSLGISGNDVRTVHIKDLEYRDA